MSYKVLLTEPIHETGINILRAKAEIIISPDTTTESLSKLVGDIDAIIVRTSPLEKKVLEKAPYLKVIGRHGIGLDNIDMDHVKERSVIVVNVPDGNVISVREYVIGAILLLAKKYFSADQALRTGVFADQEGSLPGLVRKFGLTGMDVAGKTLGIVGYGKIGRSICQAAKGLAMNVIAFDPYADVNKEDNYNARLTDNLDELLARADFISLNVPLTPETVNLITYDQLTQMKRTSYLINAARGGIVNEEHLATALKEHLIAGAVVDVFNMEPPRLDHPLFTAPNIILTPHIAGSTEDAVENISVKVAEQVIQVLEGLSPAYKAFPF